LIEKTVMIVNNGDSETKLYTFFFQGDGWDQLSVDSNACNSISVGNECALKISYNAKTALGNRVTLTANSDNTNTPHLTFVLYVKYFHWVSNDNRY
jgi:hypothetical protein